MNARWQSGNGAKFRLFGSAIKAACSGRTNSLKLSFPAPFLWFFLWTNKERTKKKIISTRLPMGFGATPHIKYNTKKF
jgi:hypothetical protein